MTTELEQIQSAVRDLYKVFAIYPIEDHIDACSHCVSAEDQARIKSKPLQELTEDDLQKYAFKAISTWGNVDDFRAFLPRFVIVNRSLNIK
jgi:hypothetical protein